MRLAFGVVVLAMVGWGAPAPAQVTRPAVQAFEAATIKPVDPEHPESGRYYRMESTDRFVVVNFTLKLLIAAAYDLNPRTISGGPSWGDAALYDIVAKTPGPGRPGRAEQMAMLRTLLGERFGLQFHRESKVFSIYGCRWPKAGRS